MKRKGSFAIYLEPWHADIKDFLDLRKNTGKEERRARDLFYALWIPDLFMKRVEQGGNWTLMCPNECPGLADCYGDEFEKLYTKYEKEGRGRETMKAQELWFKILESQIETGTPYMLYKDAANRKSNQKHLGTIKSSNLCTEIIEYTAPDEVAVCNLASIALPMYLKQTNSATKAQNKKFEFDFNKLYEVTKVVTRNLNKVIDLNYYPVEEAKNSNMRHRPIGIGVQGLADVFAKMGYAFDSDEARELNRDIFEMIYYAAMEASMEIAKEVGPYETFKGSDISKGIFQFDYWESSELSPRLNLNWNELKEKVKQHGARNSLLLAPMPTASCQVVDTEFFSQGNVKSFKSVLEQNKIDWKAIESKDFPHWITLKEPVVVDTMNGEVETNQMYYNGHKQVYHIEMEDGSTMEATGNHRFLVNRPHGQEWVYVQDLQEEDDIVEIKCEELLENKMI